MIYNKKGTFLKVPLFNTSSQQKITQIINKPLEKIGNMMM